MSKTLPQIAFKTRYPEVSGIEVIRLEEIRDRVEDLTHSPQHPHQIAFYKLVYYTKGKTQHLVDFKWYDVEEDTVLYLSKGQVNAFKFNPEIEGYVILFTEDYFKKQLNTIPKYTVVRLFTSHLFEPKIQVPQHSAVLKYIELLYHEFYKPSEYFNKKNIIDSLFNIIFSKVEALKKHQTHAVEDSDKLQLFLNIQTLLKSQFKSHKNADYYAQQLHITYKHLNVTCKAIIQSTAKQYIDAFVILEAKRKLINSSIKSTELAYDLGFNEATNFVKYFKKHTGFTPNAFKKMYS
ncbi:AraC family transcriptional regulator [Winogradskyella sp.]|uniref:AraC family transcriptional regulator n=1 Tax=Winogradskyella sp. TaxID=1883156 RepID=UPI0025FE89B3|nr:helix-turn-helix transcriptional regulator [Winogradskyella sp.]MCT4631069.1 helix-turn-helix transcriptional regulator [Winogradskyella sp.]